MVLNLDLEIQKSEAPVLYALLSVWDRDSIFTLRVLCIYLCMMTYLFKRYFRIVLGSQKTCLTGFKFLSLWDAVTLCLLVVI